MPFRLPIPLLLLLLLTAPQLRADEGLVTLNHRPAKEVAQLLDPFLEPEERAVANGDQLILSAPPERLHRLASIARTLDRPLQRLRLTLSRNAPAATGTRRYHIGETDEQRITLTEGEEIVVFEGVRDLVVRRAFDGFHGRGVEMEERERGQSIRARVWLVGGKAVIEMGLRRERPDLEGAGVDEMRNRVPVIPGEWLQLRGPEREPRTLATARDDSLWLKVEISDD